MTLGIAARLKDHLSKRRAMRDLRTLDAHILRDIGMNPDKILGINLSSYEAHRLGGGH